jgi:hypothetical protein
LKTTIGQPEKFSNDDEKEEKEEHFVDASSFENFIVVSRRNPFLELKKNVFFSFLLGYFYLAIIDYHKILSNSIPVTSSQPAQTS